MERQIDIEVKELKDKILEMGAFVEQAICEATDALILRNSERFEEVFHIEEKINALHMKIDELCLNILARQSPLATDLRFILSVIKINTDLERMGDQAVNIAHNGRHYIQSEPIKPLIDLPKMAREVRNMVSDALQALVRQDSHLAEDVIGRDDIVDNLKNLIFRDLVELMQQNPKLAERALDLILIARNLERLGDHATNIAEDVIFSVTGRDVRHGVAKT